MFFSQVILSKWKLIEAGDRQGDTKKLLCSYIKTTNWVEHDQYGHVLIKIYHK